MDGAQLEGVCTCAVMVNHAGLSRTVLDPMCGLSAHRVCAAQHTGPAPQQKEPRDADR